MHLLRPDPRRLFVYGVALASLLLIESCTRQDVGISTATRPERNRETDSTPASDRPATASREPSAAPADSTRVIHVPTTPSPARARDARLTLGPPVADLPGWEAFDPKPSLVAFRKSCAAAVRRGDRSGLTRKQEWREVCAAAAKAHNARHFFETRFATLIVGDGLGLNTGYFTPQISGARQRGGGARVPIYRRPLDLVTLDRDILPSPDKQGKIYARLFDGALYPKKGLSADHPDAIAIDLAHFQNHKGNRLRGRIVGRTFMPYHSRREIEAGALAGQGLELGWAHDPYEFFFLQVQGSGQVRLPDGSVLHLAYDGKNGHPYKGIGRLLLDRNLLAPDQATMHGVLSWLRANPEAARDLMHENSSYIFFRAASQGAPPGALGIPVSARITVAADPNFIPLGAPLWLETRMFEPKAEASADAPGGVVRDFSGLMVAQDVGSAIKGPNRLDLYWGAGLRAALTAGAMAYQGRTTILLPQATVTRLMNQAQAEGGNHGESRRDTR